MPTIMRCPSPAVYQEIFVLIYYYRRGTLLDDEGVCKLLLMEAHPMRRIIIITLAAMIFLWLCSGTALALPEGAVARLGKGTVNEVAFSPDGETLAVASS